MRALPTTRTARGCDAFVSWRLTNVGTSKGMGLDYGAAATEATATTGSAATVGTTASDKGLTIKAERSEADAGNLSVCAQLCSAVFGCGVVPVGTNLLLS